MGPAGLLVPGNPIIGRGGGDAHLRALSLRLSAGARRLPAAVGLQFHRCARARGHAAGGVPARVVAHGPCCWR
jgi:hypothetical protein